MTDIFVGSVAVGVVPDARGWEDKLRQQLLPPSRKVGDEVGQEIGGSVESGMADSGDKSAKEFGDMFKARIKEIMDTLPKVQLDGDATPVERKMDDIKTKLMMLSNTNILDSKKAIENLTIVEADIKHLADMSKDIKLDFSTKDALGKIAELRLAESKLLSAVGGGGVAGKKSISVSSVESAVSTASGAASAGTGVLGNIMSFFGGIGGFFGGGGGGGGIAAAAPAAASGGGGGGIGLSSLGGLAGPAGIGALIVAASPWIGQVVGSAIVGVLGSALAGMGIAGAVMTGKLSAPFKTFTTQASADMKAIGTPLVLPLRAVIKSFTQVMNAMTPTFTAASHILAGPIQTFFQKIAAAFGQPAVAKSIEAVATSFGSILNAISPDIAPDMVLLANSITSIADTIAKNPQAIANVFQYIIDFINFILGSVNDLAKVATVIERYDNGAVGKAVGATTRHVSEYAKGIGDIGAALLPSTRTPVQRLGSAEAAGRAITQAVTFKTNATPGFLQAFSNQSMSHVLDNIREFFVNVGHIFEQGWNNAYNDTVRWITRTWDEGHNLMVDWGHDIAHWYDDTRHDIAHWWDLIYEDTVGAIIRMVDHAGILFNGWYQNIINWFDNTANFMTRSWNIIYSDTIGAIIRLINSAMNLFSGWYRSIINFFAAAPTWLINAGRNIIGGLYNGIKAAIVSTGSWFVTNVYDPVINSVKHAFGISSPAKKMEPIGKQIITGILHGMLGEGKKITHFVADVFGSWPKAIASFVQKGIIDVTKLPKAAMNALASVWGTTTSGISSLWHAITGGGGGGNVARWAGTVSKALTMLGLPQSLSGQVLTQIQSESGGNVNAINLSDINARMGDPSRGLLQVIGATFSRYHVPGTSMNIYDPLANIAAAINYARNVYGSTLMRGGMGLGSGHGYDTGGWLPTGVTLAYNMTGQPERILSPAEMKSGAVGGTQYHAHFDGLTGAAIESHVRTAFVLMNMQQGNLYRQGRRT